MIKITSVSLYTTRDNGTPRTPIIIITSANSITLDFACFQVSEGGDDE